MASKKFMKYNKNLILNSVLGAVLLICFIFFLTACGFLTNNNGIEEFDEPQQPDQFIKKDDFHMQLEREEVIETAPQTGCFAPGFTLTDLDGNDWSLEDFCGHSLIVMFWDTICSPCIEDMNLLEELNTSDERITVIAINVREQQEVVKSFAQKKGYSFQILLDTKGEVFKQQYLLKEVPVTIAINSRGEITFIQKGPMGKDNLEMLRRSALEMMELYPIIK
ncbi:TlpA family protein disulfide reductase [Candidatus Contubernalis alkaliaceticus]|uniref:TlpA family protein disulfide reductase n=1 Tax=Candidatus Contubernalis alkaliaceticus TaxID=338645 RepID=UPI001F4C45FB|nr:TlpA disulfide reductase family protein [Candidatus Contubernalis alkalaceticus]UNC91940.1 TlpA family protein disulfide reductase [Candidatus Contubernalis alkalaceticus]